MQALNLKIVKEGYDEGKGFHYITIENESGKVRLKGEIYSAGFYRLNQEDRAENIQNNRSFTTRAAELRKVEQTLNRHYQQSVTNVLNSLTDSMVRQEKEHIKHTMNATLHLIEQMTEETVMQTQNQMRALRESTTNMHKDMLDEKQQALHMMRNMRKEQTKMQAKQWIIPTLIGVAMVTGMAIGTWAVTERLNNQLQALQELEQTIAQTKRTQDKYIKKAWGNAIGVKNEPTVWQDSDSGLWVVQYNKGN